MPLAETRRFQAAIAALKQAYESLIACEWKVVNAALREEAVSIPANAIAAPDFTTGWEDLRGTVNRIAEFYVIPSNFGWLHYAGCLPCSFAHPEYGTQ